MRFKPGDRVKVKKALFRRLVGRVGTVRGFRGDRYEVYLPDYGESIEFRAAELEPIRQDSD